MYRLSKVQVFVVTAYAPRNKTKTNKTEKKTQNNEQDVDLQLPSCISCKSHLRLKDRPHVAQRGACKFELRL